MLLIRPLHSCHDTKVASVKGGGRGLEGWGWQKTDRVQVGGEKSSVEVVSMIIHY